MLIGTLRQHSQVLGFGELFKDQEMAFNVAGFENNDKKLLKFRRSYPLRFLDEVIFSSYDDSIKAVGFKLFPDQISNGRERKVWKWLEKNKDINIVLLHRENLLSYATSNAIARNEGKYSIKSEAERSKKTVGFDPRILQKEFELREAYMDQILKGTAQHNTYPITYEHLVDNLKTEMKNIQGFLGLKFEELSINTIKQEVRPMSQVVENYNELKDHFSATRWHKFFE